MIFDYILDSCIVLLSAFGIYVLFTRPLRTYFQRPYEWDNFALNTILGIVLLSVLYAFFISLAASSSLALRIGIPIFYAFQLMLFFYIFDGIVNMLKKK